MKIFPELLIAEYEVVFLPIRAQGAGGQRVNKVATAVQLRFDIYHSSLPELIKQKLLAMSDQRIAANGIITIKAQNHRRQEQNKAEALARLQQMIDQVNLKQKTRIHTRPGRGAVKRRLEGKKRQARIKTMRAKVTTE